jgi:hypothetical protein
MTILIFASKTEVITHKRATKWHYKQKMAADEQSCS